MAKTKYEVTYVIKPGIDEDSEKVLIDHFDKVVTDNGTEELESRGWGKRRFAYETKEYREGTYHIMTFVAEDSRPVDEFGRLSYTDSQVSCSMTVKLDRQFVFMN